MPDSPEALAARFGLKPAPAQPSELFLTIGGGPTKPGSAKAPEDRIRELATEHGIDPDLAVAVARRESSLDPNAVGDGGKALGTFQLHSAAAQDAGVDRSDPDQNLIGGVKYLKQLSDRYGGDTEKALQAYNGGLDNVDKGTVSSAAQQYAREVLGTLGKTPSASTNIQGADAEALAQRFGLRPADDSHHLQAGDVSVNPNTPTYLRPQGGWDEFWQNMYAAIPQITGTVGAGLGGIAGAAAGGAAGTLAVPVVGTVGGAEFGGVTGALAGAGVGGAVGRGIQRGIDTVFGRPDYLQNPQGEGEAGTEQMMLEVTGRAMGGVTSRLSLRGAFAPKTPEAAARVATNKQYGLGLSVGTMTDNPVAQRAETLSQRGLTGFDLQSTAQKRTDVAVKKAVGTILDTLGADGTPNHAGQEVQAAVQAGADRAGRRLEGSIATNIAPKTPMAQAGEIAESGVQAGRTAFSRQEDAFHQMVADSPHVDMGPMHKEAWRVFNDDIMPKLIETPALGPNTGEWKKLVRMYQQATKSGSRVAPGPDLLKALQDAALDKSTYAPLRVIGTVLATPGEMSFAGAINLRAALRDAGKGGEMLGDLAQGLATYFETGGRTSAFKGLRNQLVEANPLYEQMAEAYRTNRTLFQSTLVEKAVDSNPESVLATLGTAEGRYNVTRIRQLQQVLTALPQTYGTPEEIAAGERAWHTVRAEWFRREVAKDNVFGMADRMKKVDPEVLKAWFPDLAGRNVVKQAEVTGKAFESQFLAHLAEADPVNLVHMIGSSPKNVNEFIDRIHALPGPVRAADMVDRVRRSWTETTLIAGAPEKLAERIGKADPDVLAAWFRTPQQQDALEGLRRIGNALEPRQPVRGMGAYESLAAMGLVAAVSHANLAAALTTGLGYEGVPGFVSWAMYNQPVQRFLMNASSPTGTVLSKTSNVLRALNAYRSMQMQAKQQALAAQQPQQPQQPVGAP